MVKSPWIWRMPPLNMAGVKRGSASLGNFFGDLSQRIIRDDDLVDNVLRARMFTHPWRQIFRMVHFIRNKSPQKMLLSRDSLCIISGFKMVLASKLLLLASSSTYNATNARRSTDSTSEIEGQCEKSYAPSAPRRPCTRHRRWSTGSSGNRLARQVRSIVLSIR